jgi:chemotaxis protein methyltransferase CheR
MAQIVARESSIPRAPEQDRAHWHSLSVACGLPLHAYRDDHVAARIERSVEREGLGSLEELTALVRRDASARARFRRALAISVTGRFRDPQQFDLLGDRILPDLLARGGTLSAWSAGCSTGLELLSLADLIDRQGGLERSRLLGSDLLAENIETAREGGGDEHPSAGLAARCRFEVRDLILDGPPDGAFSLILCRNVAIYFAPDTRAAVMTMLAASLAPGGVLLLGRSERLIDPGTYGLESYVPHSYRRPE